MSVNHVASNTWTWMQFENIYVSEAEAQIYFTHFLIKNEMIVYFFRLEK